jgi:hypothetical protein
MSYAEVVARHPAATVIVPPRANAVPSAAAKTAPTQRDAHLRCMAERGRMGAGGTVVNSSGPAYTESVTRITPSLMHRGRIISTDDYPPAPYIENIGVRPDITIDYMTRQNLVGGGQPFVAAFTQALVQHAQATH